MKIPFNTPARKRLVVPAAMLLSLAYVGFATREFVASWLADRVDVVSLERAARLDPGDADYRNRLGRYHELVARDPVAAVQPYRAAVQLNPHSARYWFDLARAYQVIADTANQPSAPEHAIKSASITPTAPCPPPNPYFLTRKTINTLPP